MGPISTEPVPSTTLPDEYDRVVRDDIELFRAKASDFLAGKLTDDEFRPFRLRRGIYGQRQPGVQMVRTKVPGGMVTAGQIRQLARIADEFAGGKAHLTTRQNVQFHFVPLAHVPDLLHLLADFRLTTREACYNTVRNVTCCPLAGLLPEEPFDVRPYARRLAFAFLHKDLTDNLPRKFKIAFSACSEDCMALSINDVGLRAEVRKNEDGTERRGFRMLAGGGLGAMPHEARVLDEFVPEDRLIQKVEALIQVFNKYGNRANKMKARLKFVVRERGFDWLQETVDREYAEILEHGGIPMPEGVPDGFGGFESSPAELLPPDPLPVVTTNGDAEYNDWLRTNVRGQRQPGYAAVTVRVEQGNLTGDGLRALADISKEAGESRLRLTMDQNIVLAFVPLRRLHDVYSALKAAQLAAGGAGEISDITTCPGAYSCNLGLTKTMNLGSALSEAVRERQSPEVKKLAIKISGCPNSCAQHWTADLGFYGNARKIEGREVPYYMMVLGGGRDEAGVMRYGLGVQALPAKLVPEAVRRVLDHYEANRAPAETFRQYVFRNRIEFFRSLTADLVKPVEMSNELFQDWGDFEDFSLKLGRGECAA